MPNRGPNVHGSQVPQCLSLIRKNISEIDRYQRFKHTATKSTFGDSSKTRL